VRVHSRVTLGVLSVASVILLASCGGQAPADKPAEPAATPAAAPAAPPIDVKKHMDEHFSKVTEVQAAVVRGDIVGAKEGARWIADHQETAGLPASGQPSLDTMKKAAAAVADAADIKAAAQGSADMAVACGSCHAAGNVKPAFPALTAPVPKNETDAHMLAHQHAVDMLYEGLVGPSEEAWTEGARALKASPLTASQLPKAPKPSKEVAKAEADANAVADKVIAARDAKARGAVFAELVGGCASCHALYGRVLGEGLPKK
jgi:mono/diheme cytochrome c family protein